MTETDIAGRRSATHQSLIEWNDTRATGGAAPGFLAGFANRRGRAPDAVAVVDGRRQLTYGGLDRRSSRLARALRLRGVGPETPVGVYLGRGGRRAEAGYGLELAVATLAILKAGGVYVPLDPTYPTSRLVSMIADSGVERVLTRGEPPAPLSVKALDLDALACDADADADAGDGGAPLELPGTLAVAPPAAAYVVYTSGSTGRPRGVVVSHRALGWYCAAAAGHYALAPGDRLLQLASVSFDISIGEIFPCLLAGATLVFPTGGEPATDVFARCRERAVTVLFPPTALWHELAALAGADPRVVPETLRLVSFGGERVMAARLAAWRRSVGGRIRLVNGYGPTETTVEATLFDLTGTSGGARLIGRPVAEVRAYVLDRRRRPVAAGVDGELVIAGPGLARGYYADAAATAARFVPDPFAGRPGERMYLTGDRVRWRLDGELEFQGRLDRQVKIRGFRVEPAEVEAVLAEHPAVEACAAVVRDESLLAFVTGGGEAGELRRHLARRLPAYMVPAEVVSLPELPRTASGKLDRTALSSMAPRAATPDQTESVPRDDLTAMIAGVFSRVLDAGVGPEDDFFQLGGHSLRAAQVVARLRQALGREVELRAVFEHPTPVGLARHLAAGGGARALPPPEPARGDEAAAPLSFAQRRFFFLDRLEGGAAYHLAAAWRLRGALDAGALERAAGEVVRRHDVLRAAFSERDGEPTQTPRPFAGWRLPAIDLRRLRPGDRRREIRRLSEREVDRRFDLGAGEPLRTALLRLGDADHLLLVTLHHIVADGWSATLLVRELAAAYAAIVEGRPISLPPLDLQYADVARWERRWLAGPEIEAQLDHWRRRLAGTPPLDLPFDRPRRPGTAPPGARLRFELGADLSARLERLARRRDATLFMVLLAGFQALLARACGQRDVCVGTPVSGRHHAATEKLVGLFLNTLALRTDLSGRPGFDQLLHRARRTTLAALEHQLVPFERVVEALGAGREAGRSPLFSVLFVLQNAPAANLELPGLRLEPVPAAPAAAQFELTLVVLPAESGLRAELEYRRDLFDRATVARLAGHWRRLLKAAARDSARSFDELSLLSAPERQQLLIEWNDTEAGVGGELVGELIARQVATRGDAVAVVEGEGRLSYRQLAASAGALARRLRALGVGAGGESFVGLCAERSAAMIAGILGILEAGAAYVPLDPAHPPARLAEQLEGAGIRAVLAEPHLADRLPRDAVEVLVLDDLSGGRPPAKWRRPAPDEAAYVIYTSGSTGKPKGVVVSHRDLAVSTAARPAYYRRPVEGFLWPSSFAFDSSVAGLFWTLCDGGALWLTPGDPAALAERVARGGVSHLLALPSLYREVLERLDPLTQILSPKGERGSEPRALEAALTCVIVAGEACGPELVRRHVELLPGVGLYNEYGPTEAAVWSTVQRCRPDDEVVAIGRGIADKRLYVLSRELRAVPIGVAGELYVAGAGLARGYLGQPALTAERFLPDPRGVGGRMYRTGDLVRARSYGEIDFLGRVDRQVKVRGFRVELGEIEAVLDAHPAVRGCAVVARRGTLFAYVVAAGAPIDGDELRRYLAALLPDVMVPAAVEALDAFPLTATGKVDRGALAARVPELSDRPAFAAPRDPLERAVRDAFAGVLDLEPETLGTGDDFFRLGGHSLAAMRVVSRLSRAGVEVELAALFEHPTVARLARHLATRSSVSAALPIEPRARAGGAPLSFAQRRLWLLDRLEGGAQYNMPLALDLRGRLDAAALETAVGALLTRHEILRTTFAERDGEPVQVARQAGDVAALPAIDLRRLEAARREAEAEDLRAREAGRPFDLRTGPLLRACLLRLDDDRHTLLMTLHHIVADGLSLAIMVREIAALYRAGVTETPAALPAPRLQYADYAIWERRRHSGEALEGELAYWRDRLAGAPALDLPVDRPRPPVQGFRGGVVSFSIPADLAVDLRALARRRQATLFMVLAAGWQALIARSSGQHDVSVGMPVAGRRPEVEEAVGLFLNTLVLRVDLTGEPGFAELTERLKRVTLAALCHRETPFERVVEALGTARDLSRTPLFQTLFAWQDAPPRPPELPGLQLRSLPVHNGTARFELTLAGLEAGNGTLSFDLEYGRDLFDRATVQRLAARFRRLLEAAVDEPRRSVFALSWLSPAERHQLTVEGDGPPPAAVDLARLSAAWLTRRGDAVAAVSGGDALSYFELACRTRRLARRLRALGVGPEVLVAVCLERSLEMLIAVLAVLEAGGVYVPLDPSHPRRRLKRILERCRPRVTLTQRAETTALGLEDDGRVLCLDEPQEPLPAEVPAEVPAASVSPSVSPENLAYVIHTSGSTGEPKGVQISRGSLANFLDSMARRPGFAAGDRLLAVTTLSFDIAVLELLLPFATGAKVTVASREEARDGSRLARLLAESRATAMQATPATWRLLLESGWTTGRGMRLLCGGEALAPELSRRLRATGGELWNLYGPTETTVWSTVEEVRSAPGESPIALGRPIAATRVRLCDRGLRPVPLGATGELLIGGTGLARGYFGAGALTAQAFLPDPFAPRPGRRLYRTGDLARRRAAGDLEFLGRRDAQVKVRGFRIELGEVETALVAHPGVRACAVVASPKLDGLAAFVVGDGERAALVRHASERLPSYMVPSAFVFLDALPLTPRGKVDRKALAEMPLPRTAPERPEAGAPPDELAAWLAAAFSEVVGRPIGTGDDFFAAGGHSLAAARVAARAGEALGANLELRWLFEHPTARGLARHLTKRSTAGRPEPALVAGSGGEVAPLSSTQRRLWLLDQLELGSPGGGQAVPYRMPAALRVSGRLDAGALRSALEAVGRRHEILRATFEDRGGEPVQIRHPDAATNLPIVDLRRLEPSRRARIARRLSDQDAARAFDLAAGPPMRALLLRSDDEEHTLLLTLHHIVADAWSLAILVRETGALYAAFVAGDRDSPLPPVALQYADYARWEERWLEGNAVAEQLAFWRRQLAGAPALDLPADRPRRAGGAPSKQSSARSSRGRTLRFELAGDLAEGIASLARRSGATTFMVLLAAFQAFLARACGQRDVSIGTPVAGRRRTELESLVGPFVNTVVLRDRLPRDATFRELIALARRTTLAGLSRRDAPFERVVESLGVARDLDRTPLFQVMLVHDNAPPAEVALPGLRLESVPRATATAAFDLTLGVVERDNALSIELEYRADLFDATTVARLAAHLRALLRAAVDDPARPLSRLPLVSAAERHQLLVEWNDQPAEAPSGDLVALLARPAERRPDAVAVRFGDAALTYRQLDRRAARLAGRLRALGVRAERRVAILLEPSLERIVAVVAVLKAGGAYLPLDPMHPPARLAFQQSDAGVELVLTSARLRRLMADRSDASDVSDMSDVGRAAYVIYTSGSTGEPKGVVVSHRAAVDAFHAYRRRDRGPVASHLQVASFSFDAATGDLLRALGSGATLVLCSRDLALDARALHELLRRERIESVDLAPAVARHLIGYLEGAGWKRPLAYLRLAIAGADVVRHGDLAALERLSGGAVRALNGYGVTEATIDSTAYAYRKQARPPPLADRPAPIGRPLAGTELHLLDRQLEPVPAGVVGELTLGGPGLARGYLGRGAETARRFVPHPLGGKAGERLYRTGDLARRLADGNVEFLGRLDAQVQVRGVRVELAEIEGVLAEHPDVEACAVLARPGAGGEAVLVAFVAGERAHAGALRRHLAARLPAELLPAAFVALDALPLTASGKVDRAALAATRLPADVAEPEASRPPRGEVETLLAGIFAEVLELGDGESLGAGDDFFRLGGHSLGAARVVARVRAALGVPLPLRALFEHPTVARLARHVSGLEAAEAAPLEPVPRDRPPPASWAQRRLWFLDRLEGGWHYNIPAAVRLSGVLDAGALARALSELVSRHETLRTTIAEIDGEPVQVVHPAASRALPAVDLRRLGAERRRREARRLAAGEARRRFNLSAGPLSRACLVRLGERQHALLLTLHHAVADGWSVGVMVRELAALYEAFAAGRASPLAPLPVQYADWAAWQRGWLRGEALASRLAYWRRQLAGVPPLELPADRARPAVQSFRGEVVRGRLPADGPRSLARRCDATLFMVLLAAFQALLARFAGQRDVCVGTPVAGRDRPEVEGLVGCFVNTLALRTDLGGEPTVAQLVRRVRRVTLEALAHQHAPFERVVEELTRGDGAIERSLSRPPLFQVLLAFQNTPAERLSVGDLTLEPMTIDSTSAKFELALDVAEDERGLAAALEYNADLFDATTARRLFDGLRILLDAAGADPERPIGRLRLASAAQRHQLLAEWNDARDVTPASASVWQLFAARAQATPDAVAVAVEGGALTYGALAGRARRLAWRVRALGAGADAFVGLCAEPTPDAVAGILGILAAGAAYLPLDPSLPPARLAFQLADAGAEVVLTTSRLRRRLPMGPRVLLLDTSDMSDAPGLSDLSDSERSLDRAAYAMYTSGSTGRPKGVVVSQRRLADFVAECAAYYPIPVRRFLWHGSLAFDVSLIAVFWTLCQGATLWLTRERDLPRLDALAAASRAGHFFAVPSLYRVLLERATARRLAALECVIAGGEACEPALVRRHRRLLPRTQLHNLYGPTEATVWATVWHCRPRRNTAVPIGRAVAGRRVALLDRKLAPVPAGAVGELFVSGGLARGYLGRPALTAERFLPAAARAPGRRVYRTGDLARFLADGALDFLGRADRQVKLRGFRVELGEVEAALAEHPSVRSAAVVARRETLAAFVAGDDVSEPALRRHLRERLPAYMVPATLEPLAELPRTATGKIDRRALGRRPAAEPVSSPEPARGELESVLAGIFAEVLDLDATATDGDFFELGGHSLAALRLVARVHEALGRELAVRELFQHPSAGALARHLEKRPGGDGEGHPGPPPIVTMPLLGDARGHLGPLSFAQQRLWLMHQLEPGAQFNIPVALRLRGRLDAAALEATFAEIVGRHEVLRTTFEEHDGRPSQRVRPPAGCPLPVVDLGRLAAARRERLLHRLRDAAARRPFDLGRALWRRLLVRLTATDHALLVTLHHAVADGWSLGILARETSEAYRARVERRPAVLPPLAVHYLDFARWERRLAPAMVAGQLVYWRRRLVAAPALELPTDRPRPALRSVRGASLTTRLPPSLSAAVGKLARRHDVTVFMALLAGFQTLLARHSGQDDLCVGTGVDGRRRGELEGLVGLFVNLVVLRFELTGDPGFDELLRRTRRSTLDALAHADVPFERLASELGAGGDRSRSPLFQALIVWRDASGDALELPGLGVESMPAESAASQVDLTLSIVRDGPEAAPRCTWEYAADLFDRATVARMAGHYRTLLEAACAQPRRPASRLPLLSAGERHQLLVEAGDTAVVIADHVGVARQISDQAARRRDAIAVVWEDQALTYGELDARANRLAHRLRALGAGPEARVAILLERTPEMVVAVVAALKSGGAYVPPDPSHPPRRLALILDDARPAVVVTQRRLAERLGEAPARLLCLDEAAEEVAAEPAGAPPPPSPDNLAYVYYTSGSTGRPKGVPISHRALSDHLAVMARTLSATERDRFLATTTLSFDPALIEIVMPLTLGAGVALSSPEAFFDAGRMNFVIDRHRPTVLWATPTNWRLLLDSGWGTNGEGSGLRLTAGGEAMFQDFARRMLATGGELWNLYGPTETTVYTTAQRVRAADAPATDASGAERPVAIGRPLANVRAVLLDRRLEPAPLGVPGEVAVGGVGLARGYFRRADLAAAAFVPDPAAARPSERLYLSGDLARWRADGRLEYLGRTDHQVKVRGVRIELGEVEAVLDRHPLVRACAVIARRDGSGGTELAAFVVAGPLAAGVPAAGVPAAGVPAAGGGASRAVTSAPGHYVEPRFSPKGDRVVYRKVAGGYLLSPMWSMEPGIYVAPAAGGEAERVAKSGFDAHFGAAGDRVFFSDVADDTKLQLKSVDLDGHEERVHLQGDMLTELKVSPDGHWVAFTEQYNAFVAPFTFTGKTVDVGPEMTSLPVRQVSNRAGENLHWSAASDQLRWAHGATLYSRDLKDAFAFLDGAPEELPEPVTEGVDIGFDAPADRPQGRITFVGARVVTMRGARDAQPEREVIEDGIVVVNGHRIEAVGAAGEIPVPKGGHVLDVSGKTIIPGLIDVHAHGAMSRSGITPEQNWSQLSNLAFGVTTIHDPSNDTASIFAAAELQRAGKMVAPRIFSTGTILYGAKSPAHTARVDSLEDALYHVRRLKDAGAISVKSYQLPRRDQRQQVIAAGRELEIMVLPEGGAKFQHNMTQIVDGHTGIEHCLPLAVVYDDVKQLWSQTEVGYTPTYVVAYGGLSGELYWYDRTRVWENERLLRYTPRFLVDPASIRRPTAPDSEYNHFQVAEHSKQLRDLGVSVHIGAHGQREGLAAHWEMWIMEQGGFTPWEALRSGTLDGAWYVGLDHELGSIEEGKLADLVVIDGNPLEDLRRSEHVAYTMVGGRLYEAATMNQIAPEEVERGELFFEKEGGDTIHPSTEAWLEDLRRRFGWAH